MLGEPVSGIRLWWPALTLVTCGALAAAVWLSPGDPGRALVTAPAMAALFVATLAGFAGAGFRISAVLGAVAAPVVVAILLSARP